MTHSCATQSFLSLIAMTKSKNYQRRVNCVDKQKHICLCLKVEILIKEKVKLNVINPNIENKNVNRIL